MDRRKFIMAGAAAGAVTALSGAAQAQEKLDPKGNTYLELRKYIMLQGDTQKILDNYLSKALIPAWSKFGAGPVGAFKANYGMNTRGVIHVLLPHQSLGAVVEAPAKLMADEDYMKAGQEFLNVAPGTPAFFRIETSLLRTFDGMPQLDQPAPSKNKVKSRIFQLRVYESASPVKAAQKIKMFNEGGEIEIFKRTGMQPVLFAQTIAGPSMPNLHYMLCFEDMKQLDASWATFRVDPAWKTLSADPQYKDSVSNISDIIFKPTGYSQL